MGVHVGPAGEGGVAVFALVRPLARVNDHVVVVVLLVGKTLVAHFADERLLVVCGVLGPPVPQEIVLGPEPPAVRTHRLGVPQPHVVFHRFGMPEDGIAARLCARD